MAEPTSLYTPPAAAMSGEPEPAESCTRGGSWIRISDRRHLTRNRILLINVMILPLFAATALAGGVAEALAGGSGAVGSYVGLFAGVVFLWGPLVTGAVMRWLKARLILTGAGAAVAFSPRLPTSPSRILDFNDASGVVELRREEIVFRGDGIELLIRRADVSGVEPGKRTLLGGDFARAPRLALAEPLAGAHAVTVAPRGRYGFWSATLETRRFARAVRAWHAGVLAAADAA